MRARGEGFFAAAATFPYQPRGVLLGQETGDSCVAACCRMLLLDQWPEAKNDYRFSESFLRAALETDRNGSLIGRIPEALRNFGLPQKYLYRRDLTIEDLQDAMQLGAAIAIMQDVSEEGLHALLIEGISAYSVAVRDPLPIGSGSAYEVSLPVFLARWHQRESGAGWAVIVLE